jgi:hypothetical protein
VIRSAVKKITETNERSGCLLLFKKMSHRLPDDIRKEIIELIVGSDYESANRLMCKFIKIHGWSLD